MTPRIPAVSPDAFTPEQAALVGDWSHLNFSRVVVQHPAAYRVFLPFIDKVIRGSNLPPRDREVLVLRLLALCEETYEMHHHILIARNAGMSDAEIAAVSRGDASLSARDQSLMRAAEELLRDQCVSNKTWAELAKHYTPVQLMEVVFLVGCYTVMAMVTRSFDIDVEQDEDSFKRLAQLRQYK